MTDPILPADFAELRPFAANWSLATTAERTRKRHASDMREIRTFYDAAFPRAAAALQYLNSIPYDDKMDAADRNLMNLFLSLSEVATAVEWYRQPQVVDGYDPARITMPVELP